MSLTILTENLIGTGVQVPLAQGDQLYVPTIITVQSTDSYAIQSNSTGISVEVRGTVQGHFGGIILGINASLKGHTVVVGEQGSVSAYYIGIEVHGYESKIINAGEIFSASSGIVLSLNGGKGSSVVNSGMIIATDVGISRNGATDTGKLTIQNSGTIQSEYFSFASYNANSVEIIRNTGSMIGIIMLSGGNDRYDGRGGHVTGNVYAGDGKDTLIGGAGREVFHGDGGADRITGGGGNDVFLFENFGEGKDTITDFSNKAGNNDIFRIAASPPRVSALA